MGYESNRTALSTHVTLGWGEVDTSAVGLETWINNRLKCHCCGSEQLCSAVQCCDRRIEEVGKEGKMGYKREDQLPTP